VQNIFHSAKSFSIFFLFDPQYPIVIRHHTAVFDQRDIADTEHLGLRQNSYP
jgi:hypothetical protein